MTVGLTTVGRTSGERRRIEIWMFEVERRYVITGTPGPRDWFANVQANPSIVVHVLEPTAVDLAAQAITISDAAFRRTVFTAPHTSWYRTQRPVAELVATSPMIEVTFEQDASNAHPS